MTLGTLFSCVILALKRKSSQISVDNSENAEERVTESDSARKGRIDLTQFEGVFEGDHPKNLFEEVEKRFRDGGVRTTPLYLDQQYVNAITLLPDLIAELKRTYDKIDVLKERLQFSEHIMETMHDEHYADLVMDFIEQAHPSKWCDWGHCRECQRSKKKASQ